MKLFRRGRLYAFHALFEAEFGSASAAAVLARRQAEEPLPAAEHAYAVRLLLGVEERCSALEQSLQQHAPARPVDQIAPADRAILCIALYELLFNNAAVPTRALINEAVEIAQTYGGDPSRRFVNGVLGSVSRQELQSVAPTAETEESRVPD